MKDVYKRQIHDNLNMPIIRFIKNWTLPIAMLAGALSYFIYTGIPALEPTKPYVARFIDILQPTLIFAMLFITFCKVNPRELRPCRWHGSVSYTHLCSTLIPVAGQAASR